MEKVQHPPLLFEKSAAAHFGYMPWVQFSFGQWLVFRKAIKPETFELMNSRLKDPSNASPKWATHFGKTIEAIGVKACMVADDLYEFVSSHPLYKENKHVRAEFAEAVKKQAVDMEAMIALMPPEDAEFLRVELEGFYAYMKRREEHRRLEKRKARRRKKTKQREAAAKARKAALAEAAAKTQDAPPSPPASTVASPA